MNSVLKQRLALWFLGLALPKAENLKPQMRAAMFSVGAAAMGGVLIALAAAAGLVACYSYLVAEGIENILALVLTGILALALAMVAFFLSKSAMQRTVEVSSSLDLFSGQPHSTLEDTISLLFSGFLDGVLEDDEDDEGDKNDRKTSRRAVTSSPDDDTNASVIDVAYSRPPRKYSREKVH